MVDYLNFDYNDKEKVKEVISEIHMEINKYLVNPIIGYKDASKTYGILTKETSVRRILKADVDVPNNPEYMNQLLSALDIIEHHIKPFEPKIEILGFKKYSESITDAKKYDGIALENALIAKSKLEEIKAYMAFVLVVMSDLKSEKDKLYEMDMSDEERKEKIEPLNIEIAKMHVLSENLEEIRYRLDKIKTDLFDLRGLQDDERRIINEFSVEYDILDAKRIIEKFKKKLTVKENRQNIYDACNSKSTLSKDGELIEALIKKLRAERDERFDSKEYLEGTKISNFMDKIHNGSLTTFGVSMRQFVNEEKMTRIQTGFFGFNNYTIDEQIVRLEMLNVAIISTQQELQDYLTSGNKEISLTRTVDGKLNITIGHKLSYDEEIRMRENGTTEEAFLSNKCEITYVYDIYKGELDSVSYKDNVLLYQVDIESELGKNVKNHFSSFLGALEGSLSFKERSLLGFRFTAPESPNISLKGIGSTEKIEIKSKKNKNITTKLEAGATLGEIGFTLRRGIKAKIIDINLKGALESKKSKLEFKINNYFENLKLESKTKLTLNNLFFTIQKDKVSAALGTQLNPIAGLEYNKEDKTLAQKNFLVAFTDNAKLLCDGITALFYSYILDDQEKASKLLGFEEIKKIEVLDVLKKCIRNIMDMTYAVRDAETYINENDVKNIQQITTSKKGKLVEDMIDKFGKPKEEKLETFTTKSTIKGAENLDKESLDIGDIRTIDGEISRLLDVKIINDDLKTLRELFTNTTNPLIYFDIVKRVQAENDEVRKSILNIFHSVSKKYILNLLETNDVEKLREILTNQKYKDISIEAFKKADKDKLVALFSTLSNESNLTLDEIIESNKSVAKKVAKISNDENVR